MAISPTGAVSDISAIATQLRTGAVTPQRESQLEQQLVDDISGANPSANWGMIAVIANDIADPTVSTSAVNVDVSALDNMVVPTTSSTLSTAITTLTDQIRAQEPLPVGETTLTATASSGAKAVTVPNTTGMFNGDSVKITLDSGATFNDTITTIINNTVNLAKSLPGQASSGNEFVNTSQEQRNAASSSSSQANSIVTTLSAGATIGANSVKVTSATGMNQGDPVQIGLADGSTFDTTIGSITGSTTLTAVSLANSMSVTVGSTAGMNNGDAVQIKLDSGATFNTIIASIVGNTVNLAAPLPSQASTGATFTDPTDVTVMLNGTLPADAATGGTFTDTVNVPASTNTISFSSLLANNGVQGSSTLTLNSVAGMAVGDTVQVALDNGSLFNTTLTGVNSLANTVTLATPLPSNASTANMATLTDNISTAPVSTAYTAAVKVSPQVLAMLQLQLNVLISAANSQASATTLQTIEANLINSTLTTAQFQQDLTTLIDTATQGLTPGSGLTFEA